MNLYTHAQVGFYVVVAFLGGGLFGSVYMFITIINEMDAGPKVPWRAKFLFWRWVARLRGDKSFESVAQDADKARRVLFGLCMLGAMSDLGGPSPIPRTVKGTDALLDEAERRYQFKHSPRADKGK